MDRVIQRTEAGMRARIASLPDGRYEASVSSTTTGSTGRNRSGWRCRSTSKARPCGSGSGGTSATAAGPINDPGAKCDVRCALKGLLAPYEVGNEGHVSVFDFDVEPGLLVSPERPAPVDSYGYVGVALIELVIRALAPALPDRAPAGGYQIFGIDLSRVDARDGEPFVFTDVHPGGAGARPDHDGPALIFVGDGDTRNTPVEVIETRYPSAMERHELLPDVQEATVDGAEAPASPVTSGSSSPASRCSTRWRTPSIRWRRVWTAGRTARRASCDEPGHRSGGA